MTDWLSVMERGLKAVRFGIFRANDNLSFLLDGLCCAPEESTPHQASGDCCTFHQSAYFDNEAAGCTVTGPHLNPMQFTASDSAASPQVAVVAPSPKQGSDSGPADSDIPPSSPAGPHLSQEEIAAVRRLLAGFTPPRPK